MKKNHELISTLKSLKFNDLIEILHNAFEPRNYKQIDPETGLPDEELFLVSRVIYDDGKIQSIYLCAVGSSHELNPEGPGETGQCSRCGALVTSSCKIATCPVCGLENLELT
jgi:hypothetical protein